MAVTVPMFSKIQVNGTGAVAARFEPDAAPTAPEVRRAVEQALGA